MAAVAATFVLARSMPRRYVAEVVITNQGIPLSAADDNEAKHSQSSHTCGHWRIPPVAVLLQKSDCLTGS